MSQNVLREGKNEVTVEGILSENKLDYKTTKDGKEYISGDLLVETSENNIVPINFFSFSVKKNGEPNRIYNNLKNVIENYKSIAKDGRDEADRVRITGASLEANEFYNAANNLITTFRIRSNFVNRASGHDYFPKAEFAIEVYIQNIAEEIKDDVPTERLVVTGVCPGYQGRIHVLSFYAEKESHVNYIKKNYSIGDTVKLAGVLSNEIIEVTKVEEMEFGDDVKKTFSRIKRELIITSGGRPYQENGFSSDLIKKAMAERDVDLKSKQEQTMQKNSGPGAGFNDDDVPF